MYKRILVGTDLSQTAEIATERAAHLSSRLGAELIVVHAGRDSAGVEESAAKHGGRGVAAAGPPAEVLVSQAEAQEADLIVVGSVGMSGTKRFMLGNVPNKVSHHAPTDLLIVKTDPPPKKFEDYGSVLVGTDGSPTATLAVKKISSLASKLGIRPIVVCAYEPPSEQEMKQLRGDPEDPVEQWNAPKVAQGTPGEFRWRIADAVQAQDILDRAGQVSSAEGVEADLRALEGHAAETLLSVAADEGVDLIAVGSVGMTGTKRFMLGNVPNRISHHAPTDVLILHTS